MENNKKWGRLLDIKPQKETFVLTKDGKTRRPFNGAKILAAVEQSAFRSLYKFSEDEEEDILEFVCKRIDRKGESDIPVQEMHNYVESALMNVNPKVAQAYMNYRNFKSNFKKEIGSLVEMEQNILFRGDPVVKDDASNTMNENGNTSKMQVSTGRALGYNVVSKMILMNLFLTAEEKEMHEKGYFYIHDISARRDTMNCCLFDIFQVLKGGFDGGSMWYTEPKSLDTAFDVISDMALSAASQQYGGFTMPQIDEGLAYYAEKSEKKYFDKYISLGLSEDIARQQAIEDVLKDARGGFQGWEYKFNTVASSRGDFPFITVTFGIGKSFWARKLAIEYLNVRKEGQGAPGHKQAPLFPKLVFLYDENLHGPGKELEDVYNAAIDCSMATMYPDWLSLTGEGYIPSMYKQYGKVISPMGCRAFLSPWWRYGGFYKAEDPDIEDEPIFIGRFNIGVVSLNLPMIYQKSVRDNSDFFKEVERVMLVARGLHLRTREYLAQFTCARNPLGFIEGGFFNPDDPDHKKRLSLDDSIAPFLKAATASFGITALNELQYLDSHQNIYEATREYMNGGEKPIALRVMEFINDLKGRWTDEDKLLYAVYGTPAESLCGKQVIQFRTEFGNVEGVTDKPYVSNSFHCPVNLDITPVEKQDVEEVYWNLFNGGKIQYVKYPINYNRNAVIKLLDRAMKKGFYEGVNMSLAYCEDCGHQELNMEQCPVCGSTNLTQIERVNGYLSLKKRHGKTRLNAAKLAEIKDRVSM